MSERDAFEAMTAQLDLPTVKLEVVAEQFEAATDRLQGYFDRIRKGDVPAGSAEFGDEIYGGKEFETLARELCRDVPPIDRVAVVANLLAWNCVERLAFIDDLLGAVQRPDDPDAVTEDFTHDLEHQYNIDVIFPDVGELTAAARDAYEDFVYSDTDFLFASIGN